jgi:glycosyltransferase involved in cell wall biosynthesis
MKKKIIINGYYLSRPFTGFGVYTNGLLKSLQKVANPKDWEIIVFSPVKPNYSFTSPISVKVIPEPSTKDARWQKLKWEQVIFPTEAKKLKPDLIHHFYPSTIVFDKGMKQLTSIHDATPWHFAAHNQRLSVRLFRKFNVWSNRKADRVVSVSQYGRYDVSTIFNIPKEKIDVVYNGIDSSFRNKVTEAGKKRIKEKYNLPDNFIFYIGGFEIHKNVKRLLLSYIRSAKDIKQDLVIAGGVFSKARLDSYRDFFALPDIIKKHNLEDRIHLIGVVPDEDLPGLYQLADLFIMLSLAEGFNLPLVQAFASSVPTIAANTAASQEISGNASALVDALSVESISDEIIKLLNDKKKQQDLIAKGLLRQEQFNWSDAASRLLSIYDEMTRNK